MAIKQPTYQFPSVPRDTPCRVFLKLFGSVVLMVSGFNPTSAADRDGHDVPIHDEGAMIRVPVEAFGETLYFLLDTGTSLSAFDLKYQNRLGEAIARRRSENPLNANNETPIYRSPEMSFAGQPLKLTDIACVDLRMANAISGQPCDGILGMDSLTNSVLCLNFDKRVLSLYERVPENIEKSAVVVLLRPLYHHYTIEAVLNQSHTLNLMLDTGDSSSVSLNTEDWHKVFSANQSSVFAVTVAGVGNQVTETRMGRIATMTIGRQNYTNLHAISLRNPFGSSHLGLNFLRRHLVTVDFPNQRLYLQPGKRFTDADKHDMSGLHLLRSGGMTVVHSVDNDSPAQNAGIKVQDVIASVNGRDATSMEMYGIREILQAMDGKKIILQIRRGDETLRIEFTLKRTI